jgi:hypothetical protein
VDSELLRQADWVLSKCGRPMAPRGANVVYIPKGFIVQAQVASLQNTLLTKEISGDTTWVLRSISTQSTATAYFQIQLPNGKYLTNSPQEIPPFTGFGSGRYLLTRELECPPGSKVQVTVNTQLNPGLVTSRFLLGGAYKYYAKSPNEQRPMVELASVMPRYWGDPNQNIMAPCWMQGMGPASIPGCRDEAFVYGDGVANFATATITAGVATGASQQVYIQTDNDTDFDARRMLIDVTTTGSAAGTWLAKLRAGSGYALNEDFIDVQRLLAGAMLGPRPWRIPQGDQVVVDLSLVDYSGTGTVTFACYLDGSRRRKVA